MATVYKRTGRNGKHTWYIRYRDPEGKDIREATKAKTKREAEIKLSQALTNLEDGSYQEKKRQNEVGFFEICDDFLKYSRARKRSWIRDQEHVRHLKDFFGKRLAKDIRPALIHEYISHRQKATTNRGRPPEEATINRELACLRSIFSFALHNGKCEQNPMRHVKLFKENNKRDRVLSDEEYESLLIASPDHLKPILICAYETGMRSGEILSLKWEQVDLKKGLINLDAEQTKTNDGRKVPISPVLHETLMKIRQPKGPVFLYRGKPISSVKRSFNRACIDAGITDFRFHDLRHTFVTNMRKAGKHDRVIMAITGHKTMSVFRRYDTIDEKDLKEAVMG